MSDSENTINDNYDDSSTMSIDTDNSSNDNSFKPTIKIGNATNIKLDNLEEDLSEYNDDDSYISEDDDNNSTNMPVAGETDDEEDADDVDDDSIFYEDDFAAPVYDKRPTLGDDNDDDEDLDYERTPKENMKINEEDEEDAQEEEEQEEEDDDNDNDDDSDDESEDEDEDYLQKFDKEIVNNYIVDYHPETVSHNFDEVKTMSNVVRNADGIIVDDLHRTIPILTKFEKARVLGIRAKQLNDGAKPFIKTPPDVIDGYTIARMELVQKLMPFIIRRPLPNGGCEYWKIADLELI